jgi:very-short-patch-repair endonuclease
VQTDAANAGTEAVIAALALRQHRVVARAQLLRAGVPSGAIQRRLESHRLFRLHRGVYAVGVPTVDDRGRWLAAVLACGDGAVLSHRAAATHLRLLDRAPGPVEVTVPGTTPRRRTGIRIHSSRSLPPPDVTRRLGIPCTTVERTILDIAATEPMAMTERAVRQAFVLRLLGRTRMRDALARAGRRPGTKALRCILEGLIDELPLTRSELERRFLYLVRDAGLPMPTVNRYRFGHRVDFAWEEARLIVETDGRASHDNPFAFHADRGRDLDLELAGWHVIRLSWRQVTEEPARVAALLAAQAGGRPGAPATLSWKR